MKKLLVLALTLSSVSSFALEYTGATAVGLIASGITTELTGGANIQKEAREVINDIQNFQENGIVSVLLEKKINEKMNQDTSLSVEEAVDSIGADANSALSK